MITALDIETGCGQGCTTKCEHALDMHRDAFLVASVANYVPNEGLRAKTFTQCNDIKSYLFDGTELVGHNLKFDLKSLFTKGVDLRHFWAHDTMLMASVLTEKVSDKYLEWYQGERRRRNKELPVGQRHRDAGKYSLKTLAPYFLGVEPFWENTATHNDVAYNLKDTTYTLQLFYELEERLKKEGGWDFYLKCLMPWARMLLDAELRGIKLSIPVMEQLEVEASRSAYEKQKQLRELWAPHIEEWQHQERVAILDKYKEMKTKALNKGPKNPAKTAERYDSMAVRAVCKTPQFNLDSPAQLMWLFKERLNLDVTDFDGEETTGRAVLQKLSGQGREDIKLFLEYRKAKKLTSAFFPSYREKAVDGVIHTTFNVTGARTGRLSSSSPNLQQVERGIHKIFVPRPGYKLITYDMSAIEPRLIALYTADVNLYDLIINGGDFHNRNTAIFFGLDASEPEFKKKYALEREVGKEVGLALMYGAGTNRLMESAQKRGFVWSPREARAKLEAFKEYYSGVFEFRDRQLNPRLIAGEVVPNLFGRPVSIDDPSNVHMQGLNTLIQGSASDLVLSSAHSAQRSFREMGLDAHVVLLVHDEIVVEAADKDAQEAEVLLTVAMTCYGLKSELGLIPLAVEGKIADCWEKS